MRNFQSAGFTSRFLPSAKNMIYGPLTYRAGLPWLQDVPEVSFFGLRDLALWAGISEGTLKTALSREKSGGGVLTFSDQSGTRRFKLAPTLHDRGTATLGRESRVGALLLAVFSFSQEMDSERQTLRGILKNFGFRKLAQNTYINGDMDHGPLRRAVAESRLEKHLFLFRCPELEDPAQEMLLRELFALDTRAGELFQFFEQLQGFLAGENRDPLDLARRILLAAPAYYEICHLKEIPLPVRLLPQGYPLEEIHRWYHHFVEDHKDILREYFLRIHQ